MVAQPPEGDNGAAPPGGGAANKAVLPPAELSAEDVELRDALVLCVQRVLDPDAGVATLSLETLRTEIRTATRCVPRCGCVLRAMHLLLCTLLLSLVGDSQLRPCAPACQRSPQQLHDQRAEAPQVPAAPVRGAEGCL
jgi:hypothetical protein